MISESQNTLTISLLVWLKFGIQIPNKAVCDRLAALKIHIDIIYITVIKYYNISILYVTYLILGTEWDNISDREICLGGPESLKENKLGFVI